MNLIEMENEDQKEQELVTIQVPHPLTGDCELDGEQVTITFDPGSYGSLGAQTRAQCSLREVGLL